MKDSDKERVDLLDQTTVRSFKCSQCGNMFPEEQATCDVCGHNCGEGACEIVQVSNEDY